MLSSHAVFTIGLVLLLAFIAVVLILQAFLSKTESKWMGLIMPAIMFGVSLLTSWQFTMRLYNSRSFAGMVNGVFVEHTTSMFSIISQTMLIFVVYNIATAIMVIMYAKLRRIRNNQRGLEMMNIQDLG